MDRLSLVALSATDSVGFLERVLAEY